MELLSGSHSGTLFASPGTTCLTCLREEAPTSVHNEYKCPTKIPSDKSYGAVAALEVLLL